MSMTDTLVSSTTINGAEINSLHSRAVSDYHYPALPVDVTLEDDGQISCFCGFNEDDGNTVACDGCNKWQHIRCYYPQWAEGNVPDDLQHYCVDCNPRDFNIGDARARQLNARHRRDIAQNGVAKRPANKKKKPRDSVNGWPDKHRHDRNSASPRDVGPPAKRPKTGHRTSAQGARKRSASTVHQRSASESPESTTQTYSSEFLAAYLNDDYAITSANCFENLEIGAKLSSWLGDPQEVHQITNGMGIQDIFQRYDGDMNVIDPPITLIDIEAAYDERFKTEDGLPAMWKTALLKEPLTTHACIGELRGHVGFKEDYKADPANRWPVLRHPEPFVFFHPNLPLCIDARSEGTPVRYIRRSCDPNAELKVIITGSADYHFCFIATRDIAAGEEVAIAWDSARTIQDMLSGANNSKMGIDNVQHWVSTVLANCGPCACKRQECLMAHFDKRFIDNAAARTSKGRKKKDTHISPLNTHVNSRSGSEVRNLDDDDRESRSATAFDSRDITPNTHYSVNGIPEPSERERKKLAKEEEMFRRQEEQAMGKQKKKRTSGGISNNLDIPKSATSKNSPGLPRRMDTATGRSVAKPRRTKSTAKASIPPPQSAYTDSSVQCEMDVEETLAFSRRPSTVVRRRIAPLHQRLLDRCTQTNAAWHSTRRTDRRTSRSTDQDDIEMAGTDSSPQSKNNDIHAKPEAIRLDMPPPTANPFAQPWAVGTPTGPSTTIVQSPVTVGSLPLLSPSVQASLNTPARKKLSLSDYTRRSKAKETEVKPEQEDLPSSSATVAVKENVVPATEDVTMEDAEATGAV